MISRTSQADVTQGLSDDLDGLMGEINTLALQPNQLTGLNLAQSGTATYAAGVALTGPAPTLLGQIQHGLGYVPVFRCWMQVNAGAQSFNMPYESFDNTGKVGYSLRVTADNQYLNFYMYFGTATNIFTPPDGFAMRYYIFRDPLS